MGVSIIERRPQPDALVDLLELLERDLARVFSHFRIPSQDAEDLLQDTLVAYLTKQREIHAPERWILGTLRHRCLRYWRARRHRLVQTIDSGLIEELVASDEPSAERAVLAHDLSNALSRLPDRCRSVLRLRYGLGCAGPEMAERLGYTEATVRQITHRCLSALSRQMLGPDERRETAR